MSRGRLSIAVQQRLIGPGCGVFLLRWDDATIASFAHRRIREKPPVGRCQCLRRGGELESGYWRNRSGCWTPWVARRGNGRVQARSATGTPYLMEINGRFWGSLQLAIDAGVDFPLLLVRLRLGEAYCRSHGYREGTRGRWWWGEVDHVLARLRRTNAELALPPGSPTRGLSSATFLRAGGRTSATRCFGSMTQCRSCPNRPLVPRDSDADSVPEDSLAPYTFTARTRAMGMTRSTSSRSRNRRRHSIHRDDGSCGGFRRRAVRRVSRGLSGAVR